ncbi:MAG: hypothetical protein ACJ0HK_07885, partial [Akkermansiaceae bacterium]
IVSNLQVFTSNNTVQVCLYIEKPSWMGYATSSYSGTFINANSNNPKVSTSTCTAQSNSVADSSYGADLRVTVNGDVRGTLIPGCFLQKGAYGYDCRVVYWEYDAANDRSTIWYQSLLTGGGSSEYAQGYRNVAVYSSGDTVRTYMYQFSSTQYYRPLIAGARAPTQTAVLSGLDNHIINLIGSAGGQVTSAHTLSILATGNGTGVIQKLSGTVSGVR